MWEVGGGNSGPVVLDDDLRLLTGDSQPQVDALRPLGVDDGVVQQIDDHLFQTVRVTVDPNLIFGQVRLDALTFG